MDTRVKAVFASAHDADPQAWIDPLQAAVPEVAFHAWNDTGKAVGAEIAVVWNPPPDLFSREPGIKAIFNLGAGVDALLRLPGLPADAVIVRLEDAGMAVQMAEYAAYALVRASRSFDDYQRLQQQERWEPRPDIRRADWTVGVLGMGVMGARVASALAALDYPVAGWSRTGKDIPGVQKFAGQQAFPAFLARTRVLINTLPLTDGTRDILCRATLRQLRPDAYLINMGRGEHLVEEDLSALLDSGHMRGATLDVFRQEPLPAGHPFWRDPRITITPHVAAASLREETITQTADKLRRYVRGETLSGVVPLDRGY
nr:glyoxylate/hydroxypyruvate reductase A [Allopusillimonas soli]